MSRSNDVIVRCSDKIDERTYRVNSKLPAQERAIIYVAETREEIRELFSNFSKIEVGYFESEYLERISSHWVIWGEK